MGWRSRSSTLHKTTTEFSRMKFTRRSVHRLTSILFYSFHSILHSTTTCSAIIRGLRQSSVIVVAMMPFRVIAIGQCAVSMATLACMVSFGGLLGHWLVGYMYACHLEVTSGLQHSTLIATRIPTCFGKNTMRAHQNQTAHGNSRAS